MRLENVEKEFFICWQLHRRAREPGTRLHVRCRIRVDGEGDLLRVFSCSPFSTTRQTLATELVAGVHAQAARCANRMPHHHARARDAGPAGEFEAAIHCLAVRAEDVDGNVLHSSDELAEKTRNSPAMFTMNDVTLRVH